MGVNRMCALKMVVWQEGKKATSEHSQRKVGSPY